MDHASAPPPQVAKEGAPDCWKAIYVGHGSNGERGEAQVWVCRYRADTNAFEAVQRTRAEANTVKFQEGSAFVLVHWANAGRDEIAALIRTVQRALKTK